MNRWNFPDWLEKAVIERDQQCVYCGIEFTKSNLTRRQQPSWEHIVNDAQIITLENIARCCVGCNASKGDREIGDWLQSNYCKSHGITSETVADIVKAQLAKRQKS